MADADASSATPPFIDPPCPRCGGRHWRGDPAAAGSLSLWFVICDACGARATIGALGSEVSLVDEETAVSDDG
jgi:hypothetical protein